MQASRNETKRRSDFKMTRDTLEKKVKRQKEILKKLDRISAGETKKKQEKEK